VEGGAWKAVSKGQDPLSAAQRRLLEVERTRVIETYRRMKELREAERAREKEQGGKGPKGE